jgi:hypothetical protein
VVSIPVATALPEFSANTISPKYKSPLSASYPTPIILPDE